jgi:uncharacterized membrane protein YdbT with pleckstrin-like domain
MSYLQEIIRPDEVVRHIARLHWIIYARGIVVILIFFLFYVFADIASSQDAPLATIAFWIGEVCGALLLIDAFAKQKTTESVVTSKRTILKTGFIARRTVEMNMDKVESVDVSQSALGRLLGFGTVVLRGTGAGIAPLENVTTPIEVRNAITAI